MVLILFILALGLGPIVYSLGRGQGNRFVKGVGVILWVLGWAYLAYVVFNLLKVAG